MPCNLIHCASLHGSASLQYPSVQIRPTMQLLIYISRCVCCWTGEPPDAVRCWPPLYLLQHVLVLSIIKHPGCFCSPPSRSNCHAYLPVFLSIPLPLCLLDSIFHFLSLSRCIYILSHPDTFLFIPFKDMWC